MVNMPSSIPVVFPAHSGQPSGFEIDLQLIDGASEQCQCSAGAVPLGDTFLQARSNRTGDSILMIVLLSLFSSLTKTRPGLRFASGPFIRGHLSRFIFCVSLATLPQYFLAVIPVSEFLRCFDSISIHRSVASHILLQGFFVEGSVFGVLGLFLLWIFKPSSLLPGARLFAISFSVFQFARSRVFKILSSPFSRPDSCFLFLIFGGHNQGSCHTGNAYAI